MIGHLEVWWRRFRRNVSRSEWTARLLRQPHSTEPDEKPGLLLIQIDGLALPQFQVALKKGRMPFLKHLIEREHYRVTPFYSGVPSTTPAVQGELFYGVQQAVPAFSYLERDTRRIVRMFDGGAAHDLEEKLAQEHEGLLRDGSAYFNIYTGGATDPRFCAAAGDWHDFSQIRKSIALPFLMLLNIYSLVRAIVLVFVELYWSILDFFRGVRRGMGVLQELKFILARVIVCILMREFITMGAKVDVGRGLPVVQLNFIGYDEQAHRRGPSSRFAHWSLKGIDDAIARIARAAMRSTRRSYEIWVYSDHGQEDVESYWNTHGRSVHEAVAEVFEQEAAAAPLSIIEPMQGVQRLRAAQFSDILPRRRKENGVAGDRDTHAEDDQLVVTAMGPIGHVYPPTPLPLEIRDRIIGRLLTDAAVPAVMCAGNEGEARIWTADGEVVLPRDAMRFLGEDHPYIQETAEDLVRLTRHPNAGDLVLLGWRLHGAPVSFPKEHGSHAGPGAMEVQAFLLAAADTWLPTPAGRPLRPVNLRAGALHILGRSDDSLRVPAVRSPRNTRETTLRVMTYNVHSCIGMDGRCSPERIARVIAQYDPDVVCLQELDVRRVRTGGIDQAHQIAHHLEMLFHFHPSIELAEEKYGDAILSRHHIELVKAAGLPGLHMENEKFEPRGALWVRVTVNGRTFNVLNTHLSLNRRERIMATEALLGPDWLGHPDCNHGLRILAGDFNAHPRSPVCRKIARIMRDCQVGRDGYRPRNTFSGRMPLARIDHVFVDKAAELLHVEVPSTKWTRVASDHLPLIVDLAV